MSRFWERTLVYLGLREEPDDQVEWDVLAGADPDGVAVTAAPRQPSARPVMRPPDPPAPQTNVRPIRDTAAAPARSTAPASTAPAGSNGRSVRVAVVQLRAFDDVEAVGSNHRDGRPVLLDVGACDHPTARRVIDFVSGITYMSRGTLRRVTARGYLLLPVGVTLDAEERERLAQAGYPVDVREPEGRR